MAITSAEIYALSRLGYWIMPIPRVENGKAAPCFEAVPPGSNFFDGGSLRSVASKDEAWETARAHFLESPA